MNCSQLMAGPVGRGTAGAGLGGVGVADMGSGATMGGGCGGTTGLGAATGFGNGGIGGTSATFIVAATGTGIGFGVGSTGFADSRSRFSRITSDSSSLRRKESSSMRLFACMARTISQTARTMGTPRTTKTTTGIISIKFPFGERNDLVERSLRFGAGLWQAGMRDKPRNGRNWTQC
jgi:hypothetical protein